MKISLSGRNLLITGATQGVGAAVARMAAEAGAAGLALTGRDVAKAAGLVAELRQTVPVVTMIAADLADPAAPGPLFDAALAALGHIDGLVNVAGITTRGGFEDGLPENWDALFTVNARAPFFLMQALIRHLKARGTPGSIVNIASINAHCGTAELSMYSASKGALVTLTRNAAAAYLRDKIRVNAINMGWAATPAEMVMQGDILGKGPGWVEEAILSRPLGRFLTAEEVAAQVIWLLSDKSGLQTGTVIDLEQAVLGART